MVWLLFSIASLLLLGTALGAYDEFFFSTEQSNWRCPQVPFVCAPPGICAHDSLLGKYYCCGVGQDQVCWSGSDGCGSNNEPSTSQILCGSGDNAYCCLKDREQCTQRLNQVNVCWAQTQNPLTNVTEQISNQTFFSMLSASPKVATLTVDTAALLASMSTSSPVSSSVSSSVSATTTSGTASPTASTITPSPSSPPSGSDSGLSGGAIGGVVVGVVAGVALIGAGGFFLWRRKENADHSKELDSKPYIGDGSNVYGAVAQSPPQQIYAQVGPAYSEPVEMPLDNGPVEVEGSEPGVQDRREQAGGLSAKPETRD